MTRLNRPDSLLTELRDIKRRLHALETAQRNATGASAGTALATQGLSGTTDESATPDDTTGTQSEDSE